MRKLKLNSTFLGAYLSDLIQAAHQQWSFASLPARLLNIGTILAFVIIGLSSKLGSKIRRVWVKGIPTVMHVQIGLSIQNFTMKLNLYFMLRKYLQKNNNYFSMNNYHFPFLPHPNMQQIKGNLIYQSSRSCSQHKSNLKAQEKQETQFLKSKLNQFIIT